MRSMQIAKQPETCEDQKPHFGAGRGYSTHSRLDAERTRQRNALASPGPRALRFQITGHRNRRRRSRARSRPRPYGFRSASGVSDAAMKELDLTDFPPGTVTEYTTLVCLACIFDIFTKQIGLAPRSAYTEIKRYSPTVEELTSRKAVRPFFDSEEKHPRCPYCNAAKRWHARLDTHCIEGGKTTDTLRRKLV